MAKKIESKKRILVPLQIIDMRGGGFHTLVEITMFGKPFLLVVDTGASKTAFNHLSLAMANESTVITLMDGFSTGLGTTSMVSSTATIPQLFIGELLIKDFEVAVMDLSTINIAYGQLGHPEVLGVLGGDILMKYKAIIDHGKLQMVLKR